MCGYREKLRKVRFKLNNQSLENICNRPRLCTVTV